MDLDDDERRKLMAAGGAALVYNAPLGEARSCDILNFLGEHTPSHIVDLGCGRGALAHQVARHLPTSDITGVDIDAGLVAVARQETPPDLAADRLRFEVSDAATWAGPADAVISIGASHAFDGPAPMFQRLAELTPQGIAIIGDGFWNAPPDPWCLDAFGDLPTSLAELGDLATAAGWSVHDATRSSLDEWDSFERGWIDGVRAVGTPAAQHFADERQAEYANYRGVLGFAWLHLVRT